jgi:3'-phosphoadenosine 5'-phosphosulfate (PAPS) 3'-phosphatase
MVLATKTRLAKRKQELQEVRKEKQTLTSKNHDKRCFTTDDTSGKDVLETQLKSLKAKIDKLEEEKKESEILIEELKPKIADIKVKKQLEMFLLNPRLYTSSRTFPLKIASMLLVVLRNWTGT